MSTSENQIVVYQPNETVRLDVHAEIIPGLLASIRKAASERREYGKGKKRRCKICDNCDASKGEGFDIICA